MGPRRIIAEQTQIDPIRAQTVAVKGMLLTGRSQGLLFLVFRPGVTRILVHTGRKSFHMK